MDELDLDSFLDFLETGTLLYQPSTNLKPPAYGVSSCQPSLKIGNEEIKPPKPPQPESPISLPTNYYDSTYQAAPRRRIKGM